MAHEFLPTDIRTKQEHCKRLREVLLKLAPSRRDADLAELDRGELPGCLPAMPRSDLSVSRDGCSLVPLHASWSHTFGFDRSRIRYRGTEWTFWARRTS